MDAPKTDSHEPIPVTLKGSEPFADFDLERIPRRQGVYAFIVQNKEGFQLASM